MKGAVTGADGVALVLLLLLGALHATSLPARGMFVWDEAEYASLGRSVLRGEGFSISGAPASLRPPLLPLAAAAAMWLGGCCDDVGLKRVTLAFALLALAVLYGCVRMEHGPVAGAAAMAALGLSPTFWSSTAVLMTEIPYMAFFTAAVVGFYRGLYREPRWFYVSWLAWGLALMTRYSAVLFAPVVLAFLTAATLARDGETWRHLRTRAFFLGPLVGLGVVTPWLVRQWVVFGDPLVGFKEASTQLQRFSPGTSMAWYFYPLQIPAMISLVSTGLLGLGAWWAWRQRDRFALHGLLVCLVIGLWFSAYRFKEIRQVTSVLPFLAIVAGLGATRVLVADPPRRRSWVALALVLVVLLVTGGLPARAEVSRTVPLGYPSFLDAMRALRERTGPDALLVGANYPQIHWYADRRAVDLPEERDLRQVLERSAWVVITSFERGQRPYARDLLARVTEDDVSRGDVAIFRDRRFSTVLISSALLRERL